MKYFFLILYICAFNFSYAQKTDVKLQQSIASVIDGFNGDIGVYVKNLKTGKTASIHADSLFPTASMIKIPILVGVMQKIAAGQLSYNQKLVYNDSLLYEGEDILGSFKSGEQIELSKLIMLMLTMSDNTASLWLQHLAGGGVEINKQMDAVGLENTKVNSRTPGREACKELYGWGQTTPKEMATLLEKIYKREVVSAATSDKMLRSLSKNYWDDVALSQIPPYVAVFSKNGAVSKSRSEVVLVKGKKTAYVFCVSTKNNKDESWDRDNEAWNIIRQISALLWHYYEPADDWKPAPESSNFF